MKNTVNQFVKFGIIGVSNTIISYIFYAVTLKLLHLFDLFSRIDIYIAQVTMFVLSVAWSFYWNNRFVFKETTENERKVWVALVKTYVSYAFTGLFLSAVLLAFWVEFLGVNDFIAPILNLVITVPLNFLIQKYWAFKE